MVGGLLFIIFGMTPAELVAYLLKYPPPWLMSDWSRLALVLIGLVLILASLRFNVWSQRQKTADALADDISWAVKNILNRERPPETGDWDGWQRQLKKDFDAWCARVTARLQNPAFFTRADQLHFETLGFVPSTKITGHPNADHTFSMLSLKFERLREIIAAIQQRTR